jgi:malate synthase
MSTNRYIDKLKAQLAKEADTRLQLQALLDDQVARNRALLAERDALAKDAERYRWLLKQAWFQSAFDRFDPDDGGMQTKFEECADYIIDAALQGAQP